jgi:hypothetical protein
VHFVSTSRRLVAPLALTVALLVLGTGSAHASLLVADGENCGEYSASQVFLPWNDVANYTLAPGGNFESPKYGWDSNSTSRVNDDNEPYYVGDEKDHSSLSIGSGGFATSPAMCVGLAEPDVRVFFKQTSGSPFAGLRVEALFDDADGQTHSVSVGVLGGSRAWTLSPPMAIVANLLPLLDDGTPVAFRFTAVGGSFAIDDLYVDPWGRG